MRPSRRRRLPCIAFSAVVLMFALTRPAPAQLESKAPAQAEALATAAKASPQLVKGLAKELGSTPEQAAGAAGIIFGIAKALLKPEDFAKIQQAVPGMDSLLAAVPAEAIGPSGAPPTFAGSSSTRGLSATPGFATSTPGLASSPSATGPPLAADNWLGAAIGAFSKLGIKPDMIAKAVPYLSGYLKKHGTAALGPLLEGVFKTGK